MTQYSYTQNTGNLKKFLSHIQSAGIPSKVTQKYLKQCGYTSSNDSRIITVLKAINFLDNSGVPTNSWKAYRHKGKAPSILADEIRKSYPKLFETYPEANKRDEEALRNFFSANTELGAKAIGLTVGTFKALCELANFSAVKNSSISVDTDSASPGISSLPLSHVTSSKSGMNININIELTIPATDNFEVYDNFFAAMKKHLFSND